jgi:P27 family predicted phage terminase small subunit
MTVGRKRQPTALKLLKGNPGKRPLPAHEPKPPASKRPRASAHLCDEAKKEFSRVAKILAPLGLLTSADQRALEIYAETYAQWKDATEHVNETGLVIRSPSNFPIQNPYLAIANAAAKRMQALLCEFGMTPSSRSKFDLGEQGGTERNRYADV